MSETVAAAGNIFKRIWERLAGRYKKLTETIEKLSTTIDKLDLSIQAMEVKIASVDNRLKTNTANLNSSVESINKQLNKNTQTLQDQVNKIQAQDVRLGKIEVGLQLELFHSLQNLHDKYCNRSPSGWATETEKADAQRFYNQIHILGQDGWSKKYWDDIYNLPSSRPYN